MSEKIRYYNLSMSIAEIIRLIEHNEIELDTNLYRNFIWNKKKQSLFIDSIYRNFPFPPIFLYENRENYGKYKVIDGIQRLRTIYAFFKNQLGVNVGEDSQYYSKFVELPDKEQKRLLNSMISVTVVEDIWNDDGVVEEIFYRLNIGGTSLTNQEFRNRIYSGTMMDTINNLNNTALWREFYNKPINLRYKDSEEILKFFTIVSNEHKGISLNKDLKGISLNEQMNRFIQKNRNNSELANILASIFNSVLRIVSEEFGVDILRNRNGFNQRVYMLLFIPLGILVSKGHVKVSFDKIYTILNYKDIKKVPVYELVSIGLDALEGDKND